MLESNITGDKLMIPKSQAMNNYWGNDKQKTWGTLTYCAIEIAALKLQNKEFKSFDEFFIFLANFRKTIGVILNHDPECGQLRESDQYAFTPIIDLPQSQYKDQVAEFTTMVNLLKNEIKSENVEVTNQQITLKGKISEEDNIKDDKGNLIMMNFSRTGVTSDPHGFRLHHSIGDGIYGNLLLARKAYDELSTNTTLTGEEKSLLIKQILFHMADAMPLQRGSASFAQMMYHALEKVFLGKYTYFGKTDSMDKNPRGLIYDIVAMLSPDFDFFEHYLTRNIVDETVTVEPPSLDEKDMLVEVNINVIQNKINQLKGDLEPYIEFLKMNGSYLNAERLLKVEAVMSSLQFISDTITTLDPSNKYLMFHLQDMLDKLLVNIKDEKLFYPRFYQLCGKDTEGNAKPYWSPPSSIKEIMIEGEGKEKARNKKTMLDCLTNSVEMVGILLQNKGDEDCQRINFYIASFSGTTEPVGNLFEVLKYKFHKKESFQAMCENYFEILVKLNDIKKHQLTSDPALDVIIKQNFLNVDDTTKLELKEKLRHQLNNLDTTLQDIRGSYTLWKSLYPNIKKYGDALSLKGKRKSITIQYNITNESPSQTITNTTPTIEGSVSKTKKNI